MGSVERPGQVPREPFEFRDPMALAGGVNPGARIGGERPTTDEPAAVTACGGTTS